MGVEGSLEEYFIDEVGVGYMSDEAWNTVIDNAVKAGVIKEKLKVEDCYSDELLPELLSDEDKADAKVDAEAYQCTSKVYESAH